MDRYELLNGRHVDDRSLQPLRLALQGEDHRPGLSRETHMTGRTGAEFSGYRPLRDPRRTDRAQRRVLEDDPVTDWEKLGED